MTGAVTSVAWLVSAVGMSATWIKLCATVEEKEHLNPVFQRALRRWLTVESSKGEKRPQWSETFITLFDRTFGTRVFSIRFFLSSCLATTIFFALMVFLYVGLGLITMESLRGFLGQRDSEWEMWQWLLIVFMGNIVADYISLIETRFVLKFLKGKNITIQSLLILIDTLLTLIIYILVASYLYGIEELWQLGVPASDLLNVSPIIDNFDVIIDYVFGGFLYDSNIRLQFGSLYADSYRISFITTYFTSVWIWFFILAGVLGRAVFMLGGQWTWVGRILNVKEKPLTAVGYILALITLVLHITMYFGWQIQQA